MSLRVSLTRCIFGTLLCVWACLPLAAAAVRLGWRCGVMARAWVAPRDACAHAGTHQAGAAGPVWNARRLHV